MATRTVEVRLDIHEHEQYAVASCELTEGMSDHVHARVAIVASEDIEFDRALTARATLMLALDGAPARRWTLQVGQARFAGIHGGMLRYELDLFDPLWTLGLCRNTRKFRNLTTEAIVSQVLGECGVRGAFRTVRPTAVRNYCAQYRETTLAFVRRLLEFEGIYFTFDPDGVVQLADDSPSSPPVAGQSRFELIEAAGALDRDELGVHALRLGSRVASGTATLSDYDWKRPAVPMRRSRAAERDRDLETYDYPAGYRDPETGALLARLRLEAQRVRARWALGASNVPAFAPAHRFEFGDEAGEVFAGEYVLTSVRHHYVNPSCATTEARHGARTYENTWSAIPRRTPFRPAVETPRPTVAGFHTARVRGPAGSEIHTDAHGRFRAQFHWDREATGTDADSRWLRMTQESATSMTLARVGWEVGVCYIDGDPDRPIGVSRLINGQMVPAYAQPSSKTVMAIKSPSSPATGGYNEIKLDDSMGSMRFDMRAERDFSGIVKHDKRERIGNRELHLVGATFTHVVQRDQSVAIAADASVAVNGNYRLQVGKDRKKMVAASETVDDGGCETIAVGGNEGEKVGTVRATVAGSLGAPSGARMSKSMVPSPKSAVRGVAMGALDGGASGAQASLRGLVPAPSLGSLAAQVCQGSIVRQASGKVSRTVGGAFVSVAVGNYSTYAQLAYVETIGGVKLTVAGGDIGEKVGAALATTVGGAVLRMAARDLTYSAKTTKITVGGVAHISSPAKIVIDGRAVTITAAAGLVLGAGDVEIAMKPASVKMKGDVKVESGSSAKFTGAPDDVTA